MVKYNKYCSRCSLGSLIRSGIRDKIIKVIYAN